MKAQELSINFLVKFILAVVMFGLGVVLMWNIFFSSTDTLDISQNEFDKRIFALNCKPLEVVCIGSNKLEIDSGENVLITVKIFNNHNLNVNYNLAFEFLAFELRNEDDSSFNSESYVLLPELYSDEQVVAKDSREFSLYLKTTKELPKGNYVLRILVTPQTQGMDPIPKRIYLTVN